MLPQPRILLVSVPFRELTGLNAADPRPDYYRYLPSYYELNDNTAMAQQVRNLLTGNEAARQINWDNFYAVNRENISKVENANGTPGNTITGSRSFYIVGERVTNSRRFSASMVLNTRLTNHIDFTGGISFQQNEKRIFSKNKRFAGRAVLAQHQPVCTARFS